LPHWHDEKFRRQMARTARQQLEEQMQLDRAELDKLGGRGWHSVPPIPRSTGSEPKRA
jgi:hypothetical protein